VSRFVPHHTYGIILYGTSALYLAQYLPYLARHLSSSRNARSCKSTCCVNTTKSRGRITSSEYCTYRLPIHVVTFVLDIGRIRHQPLVAMCLPVAHGIMSRDKQQKVPPVSEREREREREINHTWPQCPIYDLTTG
jgi:hypothetical protein